MAGLLAGIVCEFGLAAGAWAQASIAGTIRDSTGAALPGVTVEAASPVLIGRARTTVSSASGRYAIVDLRPGQYTVTFTRAGFAPVRREGIELTGSFAATVNAEMSVGAVSEAVSVVGEPPLVDARSTARQASMTADVVALIPTGRSLVNLGVLIPGMNPWSARSQTDVGGTNNLQNIFMAIHGGRVSDQRIYIDGIAIRNLQTEGYTTNFTPDTASAQEITIDYGGGGAEQITGGVRANYVPRSGGNTFALSMFASGASGALQGSHSTGAARIVQSDTLRRAYDVNPSGGGPILRDRLWFYGAARAQSNQSYVGGVFENRNAGNPLAWTYDPDFSRPGLFAITQRSGNARLTWRPARRHTLTAFVERQWRVWDEGNVNRSPEAFSRFRFPQNQIAIVGWTSPVSDRLLVEARAGYHAETWRNIGGDEILSANRSIVPVLEQGGAYPGLMYRAKNGVYAEQSQPFIASAQASASYVAGAHTFKAGFDLLRGTDRNSNTFNDSGLQYRFNDGVPNQITQFATPYEMAWRLTEVGAFAHDTWTRGRVSLNGGLRFDYYGTSFPESHLGPATLVPDRDVTFPERSWYRLKDVSPRLGVAYDVSGRGTTVLKMSAGRYVVGLHPATGHPVNSMPLSVTRSWNDADRDYVPDCTIANPFANGECGTISDLNFGGNGRSTVYDPALLAGWNDRPVNWEFTAGVQHQVRPGFAVAATWYRRVYTNLTVQDNLATSASDYTAYSVTAPVDPRLPGGGGYTIGGFFDLNPDKRGQVDNYVTKADRYGRQIEHWNGLDATADLRLDRVLVRGGVSTGRTSTDVCALAARLPEILGTGGAVGTRQIAWSAEQCHVDTPLLTQVKGLAAYTLPRVDVQLAGTFQSVPGAELQANYVAGNAVVQPSLGRPLSGGANATVLLLVPGAVYDDRVNQLDLRVSKMLRRGRSRTALNVDLYNALNAGAVTARNLNYAGTGTAWLQPQAVLPARLLKFSIQFDY